MSAFEDDFQGLREKLISAIIERCDVARDKAAKAVDLYLRDLSEAMAKGGAIVMLPPELAEEVRGRNSLAELDSKTRDRLLDPRNKGTEKIIARLLVNSPRRKGGKND